MARPADSTDGYTRLLLRAQQGDSDAFAQLYLALRPVVGDFAASLRGQLSAHDKEDLVQEVFLRTWENRANYRGEASAKTFVLAIAKNVLLKDLSRGQRLKAVHVDDLDQCADADASPEPTALCKRECDETAQAVRQAMARLTEVQRQAVELDQTCGLPRREALRLAKCTAGQFAMRLCRAMGSLRRLLADWPR